MAQVSDNGATGVIALLVLGLGLVIAATTKVRRY